MSMQVTFDFSQREMRAYFEHFYAQDSESMRRFHVLRRNQRMELIATIGVGLALAFEAFRINHGTDSFPVITAGAAVAIVVMAVSRFRNSGAGSKSSFVEYAMTNSGDPARYGRMTVSLSTEGVTQSNYYGSMFCRWGDGALEVVKAPDHVFIVLVNDGAFILPRRAFGSPSEADAFADRASSLLATAKAGMAPTIAG